MKFSSAAITTKVQERPALAATAAVGLVTTGFFVCQFQKSARNTSHGTTSADYDPSKPASCRNIPSLKGKVAIVTGSNSGTGYGIAYHLAKHDCKVIMAGRNKARLDEAKAKLLKELSNEGAAVLMTDDGASSLLETRIVDIMSLDSIREFAKGVLKDYQKIDYLANNAGGGGAAYKKTKDGYEANFFLNYLGHAALTTQLLPVLKDGSRIVNFSSIGYKQFLKNDLDTDHLQCTEESKYDQMEEYCRAKLCCILHAARLQQEFTRRGLSSMALSCHPGNARTSLMEADDVQPLLKYSFRYFIGPLMAILGVSHSLYDGALPAVEALIADDVKTGLYCYAPGRSNELTGDPKAWEADRTHFQDADLDKLWIKTQELLNMKVDDYLK